MNRTVLLLLVPVPLFLAGIVLLLLARDRIPGTPSAPETEAGGSGAAADREGAAPDPAEPKREQGGLLEIVVLRDDRAPVSGARVILFRAEEVLALGDTGAGGRVGIPAPGGQGVVAVLAPGRPPNFVPAALEPGRLEVTLPPGASVSGIVLLDERPPPEPLRLRLSSPDSFPRWGVPGEPAIDTDERGRFRFEGLPEDWSGLLVLPPGHILADVADDDRTLEIPAPADGLEVRVRRLPYLTGRVVDAEGRPVPLARVSFRYETKDGAGGTQLVLMAEDGRFRHPVPTLEIVEAMVVVAGPGALGRVSIDLDPSRLAADHNVGDVRLAPVFEIEFVVRDGAGRPVAGAVAVAGDGAQAEGGPTDEKGRGTIRVSRDLGPIRFGAVGYRSVESQIPAAPSAPLEVKLPAGNLLRIRLRDPSGGVPADVVVRLSSDGPFFEGPDDWVDPLHVIAGATGEGEGSVSQSESYFAFSPDAEGTVLVTGIRAGVPFRLEVRDRVLYSRLAVEQLSLGAEEHRELSITVEAGTKLLAGRIVDADGVPLPGARVLLSGDGRRWIGRSAGPDGRFRFEGLRAGRVMILVERSGHVPFSRGDFPVLEGGEEVVLTLPRGNDVRLSVADRKGRSVSSFVAKAEIPGDYYRVASHDPWEPRADGEGRVLFTGLPPGRVTLRVRMGGRDYELIHDTRRPEARIVVPLHGSVVVRWRFRLEHAVIHRIRLEPTGPAGATVVEDVDFYPKKEDWEIVVPSVLPGDYTVFLDRWDDETDDYRELLAEPGVKVAAEKESEVELSP